MENDVMVDVYAATRSPRFRPLTSSSRDEWISGCSIRALRSIDGETLAAMLFFMIKILKLFGHHIKII